MVRKCMSIVLNWHMKGAKEEGEQNPDLPQNVKQELQDGRNCMNMRMLVR